MFVGWYMYLRGNICTDWLNLSTLMKCQIYSIYIYIYIYNTCINKAQFWSVKHSTASGSDSTKYMYSSMEICVISVHQTE